MQIYNTMHSQIRESSLNSLKRLLQGEPISIKSRAISPSPELEIQHNPVYYHLTYNFSLVSACTTNPLWGSCTQLSQLRLLGDQPCQARLATCTLPTCSDHAFLITPHRVWVCMCDAMINHIYTSNYTRRVQKLRNFQSEDSDLTAIVFQ